MTALGWNGLGRPLKNSELSELEQKPNPIRRMTGKSLIIIQIQAKLRRIRNRKYCRERRTVTMAGGRDVVTTVFRETLAFSNYVGAMHT